jgi:hypothetical protein
MTPTPNSGYPREPLDSIVLGKTMFRSRKKLDSLEVFSKMTLPHDSGHPRLGYKGISLLSTTFPPEHKTLIS